MSRITLLVLGTVLMLVIAACGSDGDDNGAEDAGDNGNETEQPAGDEGDETTEEAVPEDEESSATETGEDTGETSEDEATNGEDDEVAQSEDDETAESGDEEATQPAEEGTAVPEGEGTPAPEDMQPGPDEGVFFDLSFEEANELTSFELKEPQEIPENVEFQTIMGMAAQDATEEERSEEAATVTFAYTQPSEDETQQGLPVELTQSIEMDMTQGLPPDAEQESMTIGDREVTRVEIAAETGDQIIAYMWNENDVHYSLAAILGPDLEESELENMVASIPAS